MKKIVFILSIVCISFYASGQTNYTPTGTWKYINGNDTIEVFFKTGQLSLGNTTQPIVLGFHRYVKNGVLIESSLDFTNTNFSDNKFTFILYNYIPADARNDGTFKDISLNTRKYLIVTKVNSTTMNIKLTSQEGRKITGALGYTLPRSFQLTQ